MTARRVSDEGGMTLIELIIAVSILSVVVLPITASFLIGLLESDSTRDRIADSSSAQIISAYLLSDVQSSGSGLDPTDEAVSLTSSDCFPAPFTSPDAVRLQLRWIDPMSAATTVTSYIDHVEPSGQHQLYRASCSTLGSTTTVGTTLLAHHLDATDGFQPLCDGAATCPAPPAAPPKVVSVQVKAKSLKPQTASSYVPFEFDFHVIRRAGQ